MTLDPDDPRLAAYVLGELDATEVGFVEKLLKENEEARQAVAEIRLTVGWLARELRHEQETYLPQPSANHQPATTSVKVASPPAKSWWARNAFKLASAAALLFLTVTLTRLAIAPRGEPAPGPVQFATGKARGLDEVAARAPMPGASAPAELTADAEPADMMRAAPQQAQAEGAFRSGLSVARAAGASQSFRRQSVVQGSAVIDLALAQSSGNRQSAFMIQGNAGENQYFKLETKEQAPAPLGAARGERLNHLSEANQGMGGGAGMMNTGGVQRPGRQFDGPHFAQQTGPVQEPDSAAVSRRALATKPSAVPAGAVASSRESARSVVSGNLARKQATPMGPAAPVARDAASAGAKALGRAPDQSQIVHEAELLAEALPQSRAKSGFAFEAQQTAMPTDSTFRPAREAPQSTFLIDVDRASYPAIRRSLNQNRLPSKDGVRIEELLNEFPWHDAAPARSNPDPFALHVEIAGCPWDERHRLARIAIGGRPIDQQNRPPCNLVFLIDLSPSMRQPDRLALVQWSLDRLTDQLGKDDRIAIVAFGETPGVVLPPTSGLAKAKIRASIGDLQVEAPDATRSGLALAYDVAGQSFVEPGTNRVILVTDASSKIGAMGQDDFIGFAAAKASSGVFLSVLGVGQGTVDDKTMATLAEKGRGHHAHIHSPLQAYRMLVEEMGSKLATVATDGRALVEVNPERASAYRLLGYDSAKAPLEGWIDDSRDASAIVEGHHVSALYEIVPSIVGNLAQQLADDSRKKQLQRPDTLTVRLSYKLPDEGQSRLIERAAIDQGTRFDRASDDLKLAAAVAGFGMLVRESPFPGSCSYDLVQKIIQPFLSAGYDPSGEYREFAGLITKAKALTAQPR